MPPAGSAADPFGSGPPPPPWLPPIPVPPRPKFQHRYRLHILLFVLTLLTATIAGRSPQEGATLVQNLLSGFWYSLPILAILAAHEFGHYAYCRRHNVDATLPYFIPAPPFFIAGTLGAVIRIKEAFPSKKALFDIGVAGPIAGFVVLVPLLYWGVTMSELQYAHQADPNTIYLGEPLLYQAIERLHFGALPEEADVLLHPMAFAAWFGMFATALNLLPFGQLDGGHIVYSVLGRRSWYVSAATLVAAIVLTFISLSWILMTVMMLVMAVFLGFRHPRILDEHVPLDGPRKLVAFLALVIFVVCFTPVPVSWFLPQG
ncbi:MAG TPA: site-2 protease family protein [Vicinamibacterales bacterium]|nr:site-2 protease family protein [Vicinamibacterales bacterium]